ncbi:protoheme IX farnesyltransferase [Acrasis kona]|uniref:Protoheme IX farnesyltransferase n=1 Tax=Acrasis kona TaxID=1008807 RepID=A0AAW2YUF7_9EUKA
MYAKRDRRRPTKRQKISEEYVVPEIEWTCVLPKEIFSKILSFIGLDAWPVIITCKSFYFYMDTNLDHAKLLVAQLLNVNSTSLSLDDSVKWGRLFKTLTKNHMKGRIQPMVPQRQEDINHVRELKSNLESLLVHISFKKYCICNNIPNWMQVGTIFDKLELTTYENDCYADVLEVRAKWRLVCLTGKVILFTATYYYAGGTCEQKRFFNFNTSPSIDMKDFASEVTIDEESRKNVTLDVLKKYISICLAMTDLDCTEDRSGWRYYEENFDEMWKEKEEGNNLKNRYCGLSY